MLSGLTVLDEDFLDRVQIATPCTASWDDMVGDDRVRHCAACALEVFNLWEMTRAKATSLLRERTGRLCLRLYRRLDGTILTRDCCTSGFTRNCDERGLRRGSTMLVAQGAGPEPDSNLYRVVVLAGRGGCSLRPSR